MAEIAGRYDGYQRLRFDRPRPRVLRITMDNGKMNTADAVMHYELGQVWRDVDLDPEVNAIVLTGAGRYFSAGGDFSLVQSHIDDFDSRARGWEGGAGPRLQHHQLFQADREARCGA